MAPLLPAGASAIPLPEVPIRGRGLRRPGRLGDGLRERRRSRAGGAARRRSAARCQRPARSQRRPRDLRLAGLPVANVSTSRRDGRRYVHLRLEVDDIRRLSGRADFAWSTYRLRRSRRRGGYAQQVGAGRGASSARSAGPARTGRVPAAPAKPRHVSQLPVARGPPRQHHRLGAAARRAARAARRSTSPSAWTAIRSWPTPCCCSGR